ncbi:2-oxo acid dehydrogenase subunit E2 [Burkholderia guangdongensis]|uniref:2-oxo acid dehydrogenase subunit E2 n=1 Tax=Burkholderia guangdongensis TaxID=1792500 RepID=UPI0015C8E783|nr:2-oxo acid dehydrogenase subunit E2 [Burkholderia guangdongensis]
MTTLLTDPASEAARQPERVPLKGLRGAIARNMTAGWQAPRVAMAVDVDMTRTLAHLETLRAQSTAEDRPTVTAFVLHAAAAALRAHPRMNALMREGGIELAPRVNVGLAVSIDGGLAVPVIHDADTLSVRQLSAHTRVLATAARGGTLPQKAFQGGTFTVTNLGMTGIDWFSPILNPPQVGILGVSRVAQRPVVRAGQIVPASMTTLTLVFDHRAIDGHPAALFLDEIRRLLEEPAQP